MYKANFTMQQLFEAGVQYGHKQSFWNPQMAEYIYGSRGGVHIIDLRRTFVLLHEALTAIREVAAKNGKILFVSTKRQASEPIAEQAKRCGQYYINYRWPGGMLTNWNTVSASLKTMREYELTLAEQAANFTKKEILRLTQKKDKLENVLGGIRDMGRVPDMLFVIDTNEQYIAIKEAVKLNIPIVAVVDTNAKLDGVNYVIPGNDDATKSIALYCSLVADAVLDGIQASLINAGVDLGAAESYGEKPNDQQVDESDTQQSEDER